MDIKKLIGELTPEEKAGSLRESTSCTRLPSNGSAFLL